jgi:hypothetical protein
MVTLQDVQQLAQGTDWRLELPGSEVMAYLAQPSSIGSLTTEVDEQGPFG